MSTRILEVHRPVGFHDGQWPTCGACLDVWPCSDYVRAIVEDET